MGGSDGYLTDAAVSRTLKQYGFVRKPEQDEYLTFPVSTAIDH